MANIFTGGRLGKDAELGDLAAANVTMVDLPEQVAEQIREVRGDDVLVARSEPVIVD